MGGVQELVGVGRGTSRGSLCASGGGVLPRVGRREGLHVVERVLAFLAIWTSPGREIDRGRGPKLEHGEQVCTIPTAGAAVL